MAFGGDGLISAVAGALRHTDGVVGILPGGRGNDLCRVLGNPVEAGRRVRRAGLRGRTTAGSRRGRWADIHGHRQLWLRLGGQPHRQRDHAWCAEARCTGWRCCERFRSWRAAGFEVTLDDGEVESFTGYSVAAANSKRSVAACCSRRDASLTDGSTRRGHHRRHVTASLPGASRRPCSAGATSAGAPSRCCAGARSASEANRPFTLYADGEAIAELPVTVRVLPAAVRMIVPR